MIRDKLYKNFDIIPGELTWKVYATNVDTNKREHIGTYTRKQCAYSIVARLSKASKHPIHSNRLKVVMFEKNVSVEELAQKANISQSILRSYISQNKQPSYGILVLLAQCLGTKADDLINF